MMDGMSVADSVEAELGPLVELLPVATLIHDPSGRLLAANRLGHEVLEAQLSPVGGPLPWTASTQPAQVDLQVIRGDSVGWLTAQTDRAEHSGRPILVTSLLDMTDRQGWAQAAIEGVVRRFQLSWAASNLPVFLVRIDEVGFGRLLVGNAALEELIGASEPLAGRHLGDLLDLPGVDGCEQAEDLLRRLVDGDDHGPAMAARLHRHDGTARPVLVGLTVARGPGGRPLFVLGHAIDQSPLEAAEEARRRDLARTELIYESGSDVVVLVSADGRFEFIGPSALDVLGHDRRDLIGQDVFHLVHPDDRQLAMESLANTAARSGQAPPIVLRVRDGEDEWRPVEVVARNLLHVPEVAGIVITIRDRSDRVSAQRELEERELRYRQIVELAADGIASLDSRFRIVYANGRLADMLGYRPDELIGRSVVDLVTPSSRAASADHLEGGGGEEGERLRVDLVHKDGSLVGALIAATRRRDGDAPVRSVVWVTDVREAESTRAALERSEQRLRALFNALPDLIFHLGVDGTYLDFHSADSSGMVVPPESFIGRRVDEVLSESFALAPGVEEAFREAFLRMRASGSIETVNYRLNLPDGPRRYEARLAPIDGGELIAVVRDTTELHRSEQRRLEQERALVRHQAALERASLERELERASRVEAMGYLAATMAHDVNNLLGVINNYASAIRRSGPGAAVERDAAEISAAVARGAELTQQLLQVGRRPAEPHSVECVRELVIDLVTSLRGAFDHDGGAELVAEVPDEPARVEGSRSRIEQAVMNLVLNARDAAEASGGPVQVTVSVDERDATDQDWRPEGVSPGRYVVVSVVDGGGGIPAPVRERIFEPFFSTKDGANSGLGLSIVRQVAEQHGGGVGIHPVTVDGVAGTRMELWLPARSAPTHEGADVDDATRRSVRILLVDDDDDVRRSTRHLLEGMGHAVVDVRGASGALATVDGGDTIDLVLCDVRMPGTGGAELVRRLRVARPDLPVLFVTGYADDLASAPDLRDVPVLVKPYGLEDLAGMIERHAGGER